MLQPLIPDQRRKKGSPSAGNFLTRTKAPSLTSQLDQHRPQTVQGRAASQCGQLLFFLRYNPNSKLFGEKRRPLWSARDEVGGLRGLRRFQRTIWLHRGKRGSWARLPPLTRRTEPPGVLLFFGGRMPERFAWWLHRVPLMGFGNLGSSMFDLYMFRFFVP